MRKAPSRVQRDLKLLKGRIIRAEQDIAVLEDRFKQIQKEGKKLTKTVSAAPAKEPGSANKLAQLEKQNAAMKAEITKLREKVNQNTKDIKQNGLLFASLDALKGPVIALARSFKQTPGAPFESWRAWMLSTFRKQGTYRKQLFR